MKILTFDGGGIRGVFSLKIGIALEKMIGKPLVKVVDLMAGTSTGGLEVLGLNVQDLKTGEPKHDCSSLMEIYKVDGPEIFSSSAWHKAKTGFGVIGPKYDGVGLKKTLSKYYGDAKLSQSIGRVLIPSFDIEGYGPFFFKSWEALSASRDASFVDVGLATSAAPTYFPSARITYGDGKTRACVDGGLFANNPSVCAIVEGVKLGGLKDKIELVSIGTGSVQRNIAYKDAKNWGLAGWAREIIDVLQDGAADTVDYQCSELLNSYTRIQTVIPDNFKLDDVSCIPNLETIADTFIVSNRALLESVAKVLS